MELPSSSDYLQTKKRKLNSLNKPNRNSSAYTENKQAKTLDGEIYFNLQIDAISEMHCFSSPTQILTTENCNNLPPMYEKSVPRTNPSYHPPNEFPSYYPSYNPPASIDLTPILKILSGNRTVILIESYNQKFMSGKYDELVVELTEENVNKLVTNLKKIIFPFKLSTKDKASFQKITNTYIDNLNIIVNYLNLNKIYNNTKTQLNTLQESTALILGNKEKLLQYLKERYYASDIISIKIDAPLLVIREEYVRYHSLYGVPENFNYDLDKLNNIKSKLSKYSK